MRHFVFLLLLLCVSVLSAFSQTPPAPTIKIEKVELKFIDVTNDADATEPITANPADHLIAVRITMPTTGVNTGMIRYNTVANHKGEAWQVSNTLDGERKPAPIDVAWHCSYYLANSDTQIAYEMVSCLTEYEADGLPRTLLNMTQVETSTFNTFGDGHNFRIGLPNVNRRLKLYFTVRIRRKKSHELNTTDLTPYTGTPHNLVLQYYSGGHSRVKLGNKTWGNAILVAAVDMASTFDLTPMNEHNAPYTSIQITNFNGKKRHGWFIDGKVTHWRIKPEDVEVKYTPSSNYTLTLNTISGDEIRPKPGQPPTYSLPKGTKFHVRASLPSGQFCKRVEKFQITTDDGVSEVPAKAERDKNGVLYYTTASLYELLKNITEITPVLQNKKFFVNYPSQSSGFAIDIKTTDGTPVPSGAELPCNTGLKITITPPPSALETIKSVLLYQEDLAAVELKKNSEGCWVYNLPTLQPDLKLTANITNIVVTLNPRPHKLEYVQGTCGTFTVKDDTGTPRASNSTFSAEFLKLEASVPAPKKFEKFKVVYEGGVEEIRTTNPAEVPFDRDVKAITLECQEEITLRVTNYNYVVTLVSGKYKKDDGTFVEELGHVFPYSTTPYTLQANAVIRIKLPDAHIITPITEIEVTWLDASKVSKHMTATDRHFDLTLQKSVMDIQLKDDLFHSITYPEGTGKPKLKLKEKRAFNASGTELPVMSDLPSGSQIQTGGKVELIVTGVTPTPGKLIQKYVLVMGGTDYEFLPTETNWERVVNADITDIKVIEIDDPAVAGPFTLKWQDDPTVYTIDVSYTGAIPPVTSEGTPVPKNTQITIKVTLTDPVAGVMDNLKIKLADASEQELTPTVSANVYTYTFTITSNTEIIVTAHNRITYTVTYATPTDYTLFVRKSKDDTANLPSPSQMFAGDKLYIKAEKNTPDADDFTFGGIQVNGTLIPEADKDGDFYVHTITANVTSIEALYIPKQKFTISYDESPVDYTIFVGTSKEATSVVHSGEQRLGGIKLYIKAERTIDPDEFRFDGIQVNGVTIPPTDKEDDFYFYILTADVYNITPLYTPLPKYLVTYNETPSGYTLFVGKSKETVIPSGSLVLEGATLYIKPTRTLDPDGYRFNGIKVNGVLIPAVKDGDYFLYVLNAPVTSIEADYTPRPQYTVTYNSTQLGATIEVVKKKDGTTVPTGTSLYEDTPLKIVITDYNPTTHVVEKVEVTYAGSSTPLLIQPNSDQEYNFSLTGNVTQIDVLINEISKYKVVYAADSPDVLYKVLTDKDNIHAVLPSESSVEAGTKIWVRVTSKHDPNLRPKDVYVKYRNPKYTAAPDPEYIHESIKANVASGAEGATYYSYEVNNNIEIVAFYEPATLPKLNFRYESSTDYTLDVRSDSPSNTTPVYPNLPYTYPSGTLIYIKLTIGAAFPNHRVARILINDKPVNLEKENGWYVLQLTGDVYSLRFELAEVPVNKSMLVYADPPNAHLEVYYNGVLQRSGTVFDQGTPLFAVISNALPGSLFSLLTLNGIITGHLLTDDVMTGKKGMAFNMTTEPVTEVVAYVAQPLPEDNGRYYITVEKPDHGTLRLEKVGNASIKIDHGETKEVKVGDVFEVITSSEDLNRYVFEEISIPTQVLEGTNKLVYTVPYLSAGQTHIRVVAVYAPVRPTCKIDWTLNTGGSVAVVNNTESNEIVNAGAKVPVGDYIQYTITPAEGYHIRTCYINGRRLNLGSVSTHQATLRVETDIYIDAVFEADAPTPKPPDPTDVQESLPFSDVLVYPNPFEYEIRIRTQNDLDSAIYELISSQGVIMRREALQEVTLVPTNDLPSGLYLLRLMAKDGRERTIRLVKR